MKRTFNKKDLLFVRNTEKTIEDIESRRNNFSSPKVSIVRTPGENRYWKICYPKTLKRDPVLLISAWFNITLLKPDWMKVFQIEIWQLCEKYNFQGKWNILFELSQFTTHEIVLEIMTERFHPDAIKGTIMKQSEKIARFSLVSYQIVDKPRPAFTQRVRGYRDHGSMKKLHEHHSFVEFSGPNEPKTSVMEVLTDKELYLNFLRYMRVDD